MSASTPPDDFDAIRAIVSALTPFDAKDQERIIRWAREKIGLPNSETSPRLANSVAEFARPTGSTGSEPAARATDIRTFIDNKQPQSDNQFAAAVAYYYRFEAPEAERKTQVTAEDIQDATRKAGRNRLNKPGQTLLNAHGQGYFDKAERGQYTLSTVGENLVAMALPQGSAKSTRRPPTNKRRADPKKKAKK